MEQEMQLFNILGPVMIGPSSSHTAGAARIGRVARRLLGEDVAMIHFKDFLRQDAGGQLAATGAGQGGMGDYRTILRFAKEQKPYVFATVENTTPENAVQCLQYLQKQYDEC